MAYPKFYDQVRTIRVCDPLADFLGAAEEGVIEYAYVDAVKTAGHSCPTVASAYLMTAKALDALYPNGLPERGAIKVEFQQDKLAGVCGVIANVVTLITGATQDTGFKGIGGRFDRRNLLFFNSELDAEVRFQRADTGAAVTVSSRLESVPADPRMRDLLGKCVNGEASKDEAHEFGRLWQERVRKILLDYCDDPEKIVVNPA